MGVKSPELVNENTIQCLYGINDHSKLIILFMFWKKSLIVGVGVWGPLFRTKS